MDEVIVVDSGLSIISNRIKGLGSEPKYIGWGIGDTVPTNDDVNLENKNVP